MQAVRFLLRFALAASPGLCADGPRETLLVLSKGDHTLAIVDPSIFRVLGKAPVDEVLMKSSPRVTGKMAYVSNCGGGVYNTLARIDLVNCNAFPSIDLGALRGPHALFVAANKVWFTAEAAKAVARYDPATELLTRKKFLGPSDVVRSL